MSYPMMEQEISSWNSWKSLLCLLWFQLLRLLSFHDAPGGFTEEMREISYSIGVEYWYDKQFAIRAGYFYEHPLKGDRQYLTIGLGLNYNVYGMGISYLVPTNNTRNPLDGTLRFTFSMDFTKESYKE